MRQLSVALFIVIIALSISGITSSSTVERFCRTYLDNRSRIAFYSPHSRFVAEEVTLCFVGDDYYIIKESNANLVLTNESLKSVSFLAGKAYTFRIEARVLLGGHKNLSMAAYNPTTNTLDFVDASQKGNQTLGLKVKFNDFTKYSLAFNTKDKDVFGFVVQVTDQTTGLFKRQFDYYGSAASREKEVAFKHVNITELPNSHILESLKNINEDYEVIGLVAKGSDYSTPTYYIEVIIVIVSMNSSIMYFQCLTDECTNDKLQTLVDCRPFLPPTTEDTTQEPNESRRIIILITIIGVISVVIICLLLLCVICARKCYLDRKRMAKKMSTDTPGRDSVISVITVDSQTGQPLEKIKSTEPNSSKDTIRTKTSEKPSSPKKNN